MAAWRQAGLALLSKEEREPAFGSEAQGGQGIKMLACCWGGRLVCSARLSTELTGLKIHI